jgi:hypothetical protein
MTVWFLRFSTRLAAAQQYVRKDERHAYKEEQMRNNLLILPLAILSTAALLCLFLTFSSHAQADDLKETLESIIDGFCSGWEPQLAKPFDLQEYKDRSLEPFLQNEDFAMVIDAQYYPTFEDWKNDVNVSVPEHIEQHKEGHHTTMDLRVLPLGPDGAVATQVYRYDFVEMSGRRGHQISAITYVFVRREGKWKIAHYHGSHGKEEYDAQE